MVALAEEKAGVAPAGKLEAGAAVDAAVRRRPLAEVVAAAAATATPAPEISVAASSCSMPLAELEPPAYGVGKQPDGWDQFQVIYDSNIVRPYLNNTNQMPPSITDDSAGYGPIALYVGGTAPVHFRDVSFKDLAVRRIPPERMASRFRIQQLEEFSYAWGAASADFNKDGNLDVTAGPYIYYGPEFTTRREIYVGAVAGGYPANMVTHAFDFTGDGWTDVLATESRPMVLLCQSGQQNQRRWERHAVLPAGELRDHGHG